MEGTYYYLRTLQQIMKGGSLLLVFTGTVATDNEWPAGGK